MKILWAKEPLQLQLDQSLYGAAFVLPQIARSAAWPKELTILAMKTFLVLLGSSVVAFSYILLHSLSDFIRFYQVYELLCAVLASLFHCQGRE